MEGGHGGSAPITPKPSSGHAFHDIFPDAAGPVGSDNERLFVTALSCDSTRVTTPPSLLFPPSVISPCSYPNPAIRDDGSIPNVLVILIPILLVRWIGSCLTVMP